MQHFLQQQIYLQEQISDIQINHFFSLISLNPFNNQQKKNPKQTLTQPKGFPSVHSEDNRDDRTTIEQWLKLM